MDSQDGQPEVQFQELLKKIFGPKNVIVLPVVAIFVLGLIFYFVVAKKQSSDSLQNEEGTKAKAEVQEASSPAPLREGLAFIILEPQNGSGQTGIAALSDLAGKTKVLVDLTGASGDLAQPTHIHAGACPGVGEVKYPLNNLVNGKSETILEVGLSQLKAQLPLAVNVHKSEKEAETYVACGNIK